MEINLQEMAYKFVKVHWLGVSLWIFGVLLMLAAPSPVTVSPEMEAEFDKIMLVRSSPLAPSSDQKLVSDDLDVVGLQEAQHKYGAEIAEAQQDVYSAQNKANAAYGWFLSERETQVYNKLYATQQRFEAKLAKLNAGKEAMERVARSKVPTPPQLPARTPLLLVQMKARACC